MKKITFFRFRRLLRLFSSFFVFSKCGKFVSSFLSFLLIFSVFLFPSFADTNLDVASFEWELYTTDTDGGNKDNYYNVEVKPRDWHGKKVIGWHANNKTFYESGNKKVLMVNNLDNLEPNKLYNLNFFCGLNYSGNYHLKVWIDNNVIYDKDLKSGYSLNQVNLDFKTEPSLSENSKIWIYLTVPEQFSFGSKENQFAEYYISQKIEIYDKEANPSWAKGIADKIGGFIKSIVDKLNEVKDNIVQKLTDIKDGIVNKLAEIKDNIVDSVKGFFEDLKEKIEDIRTKFKEKIEDIRTKFKDLVSNIVTKFKEFFLPSKDFFKEKILFLQEYFEEHFGALYQIPKIFIDFFKMILRIKPTNHSITFPSIEFDFLDKHYKLTEPINYSFDNVISSPMLSAFYKFYRGFITCVLFFSFGNYLKNKWNELMGVDKNVD